MDLTITQEQLDSLEHTHSASYQWSVTCPHCQQKLTLSVERLGSVAGELSEFGIQVSNWAAALLGYRALIRLRPADISALRRQQPAFLQGTCPACQRPISCQVQVNYPA